MWYEDFGQTDDAEVLAIMERTKSRRQGGNVNAAKGPPFGTKVRARDCQRMCLI